MSIGPVAGSVAVHSSSPATSAGTPFSEPPSSAMTSSEALALLGCSEIADSRLASARVSADRAQGQRSEALIRARRALEAARRSASKSSDWGGLSSTMKSVVKWAAVAAMASSAVATGGASLVAAPTLIALSASAASFAMRQTGADTKVCNIGGVDVNASDVVLLGGYAVALGVGGASDPVEGPAGTQKAAHAAPKPATTPAPAAQVAAKPPKGPTETQKAAAVVARVAVGVQAGATAVDAVATERAGHFRAQSVRESAVARAEEFRANEEVTAVHEAIDEMRTAMAFRARALEAVAEMLETRRAAWAAVLGRRA